MLKYKVFFLSYGGEIYDAFKNEVIPDEIIEDSPDLVAAYLHFLEGQGKLRKDLTFVILPIYVPLTD